MSSHLLTNTTFLDHVPLKMEPREELKFKVGTFGTFMTSVN